MSSLARTPIPRSKTRNASPASQPARSCFFVFIQLYLNAVPKLKLRLMTLLVVFHRLLENLLEVLQVSAPVKGCQPTGKAAGIQRPPALLNPRHPKLSCTRYTCSRAIARSNIEQRFHLSQGQFMQSILLKSRIQNERTS